ncbi:MAG: hypothetical protein IM504_09800 [Microcystis sp. M038S2]|jgi:uncharacterized membrane protein YGL010W|uniref:hypothetical protein n=1 Tax=unclassified Microcystis TaxID=2643300 RepID=UPI002583B7FD|nr:MULTISPECIES: hypothetical protein [unclassified Microcystis]MCA2683295.1 hypothetical protein [Microcystis sp. M046S2]MCA2705141.1 hypothetical protein [Microcystis sp. M038S2]MCA2947615.1 hypothetical protein [Microcystis sp. M109S1]MCA2951231.1 hypothetical protein [Microcystis sp. M112S1]
MRSVKKCLSIAFITVGLLLPFWGDGVQEEAKPKFVDLLEIVIQAIKIFDKE